MILNVLGLYDYEHTSIFNIYIKVFSALSILFITFVTSLKYVIENLDNLLEASKGMFSGIIFFICPIYYIILLRQKEEFRSLFNAVENTVNGRKLFCIV